MRSVQLVSTRANLERVLKEAQYQGRSGLYQGRSLNRVTQALRKRRDLLLFAYELRRQTARTRYRPPLNRYQPVFTMSSIKCCWFRQKESRFLHVAHQGDGARSPTLLPWTTQLQAEAMQPCRCGPNRFWRRAVRYKRRLDIHEPFFRLGCLPQLLEFCPPKEVCYRLLERRSQR
jgi:hypothetical protein